MLRWPLLLGLALALPPAAVGQQPQWQFRGDGQWEQAAAPATAPVPDETLDRIEQMLQNNQAAAAKKMVVSWIRRQPDAPNRDRAVFLLGQANFQLGSRIMAFYNFDELLDLYPASAYYHPALQRQFDIADEFLSGYKRRFLGMPIISATTEATEMLYRIQQRAPGSPLAEKALLRAADYYYATAQYDVAADAYAAYVRSYPRSPYLPRVRLRQAFSSLAQFRGVKFDATHIIDARQQLIDLAVAYPDVAAEEKVLALVDRIDAALADKLLVTGDFYRRTGKPRGAVYYYRTLLRTFPGYPQAREAERRLAEMPPSALSELELPEAVRKRMAGAATTQPTPSSTGPQSR